MQYNYDMYMNDIVTEKDVKRVETPLSFRLSPQVFQDEDRITIVPDVNRQPQLQIRVHRIRALILQVVGADLRHQADAAPKEDIYVVSYNAM